MKAMRRFGSLLLLLGFPLIACNLPLAATPTPGVVEPTQTREQATTQAPMGSEEPLTPAPVETTVAPTQTQATATQQACTSDSEFVTDVTIPDGTLVSPGETFTKTWRIRNDGTCTWTTDYTWEQLNASGNDLQASNLSRPLSQSVAPGEAIDISVELSLAAGAPLGSQQVARFQMRSPSEGRFGTRPFASIFTVNGSGQCPPGNASLDTYIHLVDRYCFLYPEDHDANQGATGAVTVSAPPPGGSGEQIVPSVSISNDGSTAGLTLEQWSTQKISAAQAPGNPPTTSSTSVGGEPAIAAEGLPGIMGTRIVYVIHDDIGYVITVFPVDSSAPDETDQALELWQTMRDSFVFFNP